MDPNSVDDSTSDCSDSGDYMAYNDSLQEDEAQECMEYRGKPSKVLTLDDLREVEFCTISEVEQFYSYYSLAKGFSMRKYRCDKNRAGTLVLCRQLICSNQCQRRGSDPKEEDGEEQLLKEIDVINTQSGQKHKDIYNETNKWRQHKLKSKQADWSVNKGKLSNESYC